MGLALGGGGGETISRHKGFACSDPSLTYSSCLITNLQLDIYIFVEFYHRCNNLSVIVLIKSI